MMTLFTQGWFVSSKLFDDVGHAEGITTTSRHVPLVGTLVRMVTNYYGSKFFLGKTRSIALLFINDSYALSPSLLDYLHQRPFNFCSIKKKNPFSSKEGTRVEQDREEPEDKQTCPHVLFRGFRKRKPYRF
jgi:hypothetical protein